MQQSKLTSNCKSVCRKSSFIYYSLVVFFVSFPLWTREVISLAWTAWSPKCNMTVLTQTPATSYTHIHTNPVDSFLSKSPSHANRVGRQDPLSAYLSRRVGGVLRRDRQRGPPLLFWLGLRDEGEVGMELGIGWELETPTMPQGPPLLFLLMSMTCSDRPGTDSQQDRTITIKL